jgi:hypothetical protein
LAESGWQRWAKQISKHRFNAVTIQRFNESLARQSLGDGGTRRQPSFCLLVSSLFLRSAPKLFEKSKASVISSYHDAWETPSRDKLWYNRDCMNEWLHNLPVTWMAVVVFTIVYLATGAIFAIIMLLGRGKWARVFKGASPGLLSPLGTIFGLLVVFTIFQVWGDFDRARLAVDREASAVRTVVLLATIFPGEPETQIRNLVRRHIDEAVATEWPEDGETIGFVEGRSAGIGRTITVHSFSDAPKPRANRGAA